MGIHGNSELKRKAIDYLSDHAVYLTHPRIDDKGNIMPSTVATLYVDYDARSKQNGHAASELVEQLFDQLGIVPQNTHILDTPMPVFTSESRSILERLRQNHPKLRRMSTDRVYQKHACNFLTPVFACYDLSGQQELFEPVARQLPRIALSEDFIRRELAGFRRAHQSVARLFEGEHFVPYNQIGNQVDMLDDKESQFVERGWFKTKKVNKFTYHANANPGKKEYCRLVNPCELVNGLAESDFAKQWVQDTIMGILNPADGIQVSYPPSAWQQRIG